MAYKAMVWKDSHQERDIYVPISRILPYMADLSIPYVPV